MKQQVKAISYLKRTMNGMLQRLNILNTKKVSNIITLQSLREINVLVYEEITLTGKVELLDKNYNENKKYKEYDLNHLQNAFINIVDLFISKLENKKTLNSLATDKKKNEISFKIMLFIEAIQVLRTIKRNYIDIIEPNVQIDKVLASVNNLSPNVVFKPLNSIDENIRIIEKLIKSNENTFKRLFPNEEIKQEDTKHYSVTEQATDIETYLNINTLDLEKINLEKWVSYLNKVEKKTQYENAKELKNGRGKR